MRGTGQKPCRFRDLVLSPREAADGIVPFMAANGSAPLDSKAAAAIYVVAMVAIIVAVDILVFRGRFWERLASNAGIVLVFAAFYFRFLKRP